MRILVGLIRIVALIWGAKAIWDVISGDYSGSGWLNVAFGVVLIIFGIKFKGLKFSPSSATGVGDKYEGMKDQDYFHAFGKTAISIDKTNKLITLVEGSERKTYSFSDVRSWTVKQFS